MFLRVYLYGYMYAWCNRVIQFTFLIAWNWAGAVNDEKLKFDPNLVVQLALDVYMVDMKRMRMSDFHLN